MHFHARWTPDPTRVPTRRELVLVSANGRRNLAILRLACCCGLRVSEIAQLQMDDLVLDGSRPHLRLRSVTTKGKRGRVVPLWWDADTLADLRAWGTARRQMGVWGRDFAICSVQTHCPGEGLKRHAIRRRFLSACKVLGAARLKTLTIHHGRHTYIS
jgi:integrase